MSNVIATLELTFSESKITFKPFSPVQKAQVQQLDRSNVLLTTDPGEQVLLQFIRIPLSSIPAFIILVVFSNRFVLFGFSDHSKSYGLLVLLLIPS